MVWIRQLKLLSLKQNVCSPWNRFQLSEVDLFEKVGIPVSFPARYTCIELNLMQSEPLIYTFWFSNLLAMERIHRVDP